MPVPLHCTWYNKTETEFIQIPGVTGACYQPSVEDVGKTVVVHGVPASDIEEYQGMPMFAEKGPLVIDPNVDAEARLKLQAEEIPFQKVMVELVNFKNTIDLLLLPDKIQVNNQLELTYSQIKAIRTVRNSNNLIELDSVQQSVPVKITLKDNFDRDVFHQVLTGLLNQFKGDPSRISEKDFFKKKEDLFVKQVAKL